MERQFRRPGLPLPPFQEKGRGTHSVLAKMMKKVSNVAENQVTEDSVEKVAGVALVGMGQ